MLASMQLELNEELNELRWQKMQLDLKWEPPLQQEARLIGRDLLCTRREMAKAELPPKGASPQQRQAVKLGARVLSEADHEAAMEELRQRAGGE